MAKPGRPPKQDWVTTANMAAELSLSPDFLLKNREKLFQTGIHWRNVSPQAARPTYRWNRLKVLEQLQ